MGHINDKQANLHSNCFAQEGRFTPHIEAYTPILVGAKRNYRDGISFRRDDKGINISQKNSTYNELTGIYWAWKNVDSKIYGLVHYRRFLLDDKSKKILNLTEIKQRLNNVDVILP